MPDAPLRDALLEKMREQFERTTHLIALVPADRQDWAPTPGAWTTEQLIRHLLDCIAGFCAVLVAAEPECLAHFAKLREQPAAMGNYRAHIEEGFSLLSDSDLARRVPTVFVARGETVLTLLLGNLEHLINHKHQLFSYLQQMGVPVATPDLYHFRS
ncbi:MAG: DinB family protein [Acidobacteriota bacterium]|nr:DinB family protein [Acidobacteriota bacterium]